MYTRLTTGGGAGRAWWLLYGLLAVAAGTTCVLAGGSEYWRGAVALVELSSLVVVLARIRRLAVRLVWALLALGQVALVAGDILTHDSRTLFGTPPARPWLGHVAVFAGYTFAVAAFGLLARARSRASRPALIDACIVVTPLAAVSWAFVIAPLDGRQTATLSNKLVAVTYPALDLVIAFAVAYLVFAPGSRRVPFLGLLVVGVAASVAGDSVRTWAMLHPGSVSVDARELGRVAFLVLVAAASLHPSAGDPPAAVVSAAPRPSPRRLIMLLAAAVVVPAMTAVGVRPSAGLLPLSVSSGVVFMLICLRLLDLARRHESALQHAALLAQAGAGLVEARSTDEVAAVADTAARRFLGARATLTRGSSEPTESAVVELPLQGRRESHGSLVVHAQQRVDTEALQTLRTLANSVALALDRVNASERVLRSRTDARFEALVQHSSDAVLVLDSVGHIDYASASTANVLGSPPEELRGASFLELVVAHDRPRVLHVLETQRADTPVQPFEFELITPDGTLEVEATCTNLLYTEDVRGLVVNVRDITERKEFERRLAHQAFHDDLTGLANRVLFRDRVDHALARVARGSAIAVLLVDLDDFKTVNDTLGHQAGDELIRVVADRLAGTARTADTAARLGGDEFAVLIEDDSGDNSELVARRLLDAIALPIHLDGRTIAVSASIGIARARPGDTVEVDALLRDADVAMYGAKSSGKGTCRSFSPDMHTAFLGRLELKRELQTAIERNELELRYQPVVDLETGEFVSLEALMRWNHPTRGYVSPDEFIPIAEESGLIVALGRWALKTACQKGAQLQWLVGPAAPTIAVNLSGRQLQEPTLVHDTMRVLAETGLPPEKLVLEITETAMISDFDLALSRLRDLKAARIRVALDDFGSGYSSLNYIRRLPIDVLKIDRAFIAEIESASDVVALTETILDLARIIDVVAVAEGIETPEQLATLKRLGCALGQGYLFMRPVTGDEIEAAVAERVRARHAPRVPVGRVTV